MALARAAGMIAIIAARHHVADARLLIAVVVVIRDKNGPETIHARLVLVAEVVSQEFDVLAVEITAPDGAGPAIAAVGRPSFSVLIDDPTHSLIADAEIQFTILADK